MYQKNALLTIHEFATICRTTPKTLRLYEKLGLLLPVEIDKKNNYRYYKQIQTRLFEQIKLLQRFDLPLKTIKDVLMTQDADEFMEARLRYLKEEIHEKQKEYKFLERIHNLLFEHENLAHTIRHTPVGPFYLFSYTVEHGIYDHIDDYFEILRNTAQALGISHTKSLTFYHDYDFKPHDSKIEVAVICFKKAYLPNIKLPEHFSFRTLERTNAYVYTYQGPYNYLSLIYHKIFVYLENKGKKPNGPVFEIYDEHEGSEFEQLMEIIFPVDK